MTPTQTKPPAKAAKKGQKNSGLVIQQITIKQPQRNSVDINSWRQALITAESMSGKRVKLYDLYEDLMLDNILGGSIDKRIMAITNSNIVFSKDGQAVPEMDAIVDSDDFELLLTEIMNAKFWGMTLLEFDFSNGFACVNIPRKHINPRIKEILINQSDDRGIPYLDNPFFLEVGNEENLGLILKAAPYVIYKRGSYGDWAQFAELFGMPFRKATYNSYDDYTRKQLEEAMEKHGASPWIVIPKDGDIEYIKNETNGSGAIYDKLKSACNEEILVGILGQTMTTMNGSSKSQSETHKEVEESINKADRRFVQRLLNRRIIPLLEARGFPVTGGLFSFPEANENVSLKDRIEIDIKLDGVIDIDPEYFYKKYGIPQPNGTAGKKKQPPKVPPDKIPDPPKPPKAALESEHGVLQKLFSFFLKTPTAGHIELCPMCGGGTEPFVMLTSSIDLDPLIEQIAQDLLDGKIPPGQTNADLALYTADTLMNGLRSNVDGYDHITVDDKYLVNWINKQQNAVYSFGLAKSYDQMKAMRDTIIDPATGNIKPFTQFLNDVRLINKDYNKTYLETEHMAVVRGTVMGTKWMDIENEKDVAPYLEYVTAGDNRVRDSHRAIAGVCEKVGSEFWNRYYPPNGWRCRCSVRQHSQREVESRGLNPNNTSHNLNEAKKSVKDPFWLKNTGKTEILEANKTAYIEHVPGKGFKQITYASYGMPKYEKILEKGKLPKASKCSKEEFLKWWDIQAPKGVLDTKDINKMPVRFDDKFKQHLLKDENHFGIIHELLSTLKKPDEIWQNIKSGTHNQTPGTYYLKFCDPHPIVLLLGEDGVPKSFYEMNKQTPDSFRNGILMHKKKSL